MRKNGLVFNELLELAHTIEEEAPAFGDPLVSLVEELGNNLGFLEVPEDDDCDDIDEAELDEDDVEDDVEDDE